MSKKFSGIIEYTNFETHADFDFGGFFSFGFRFRSGDVSWELGGIRPLEDSGDLLFLPLLKATVVF